MGSLRCSEDSVIQKPQVEGFYSCDLKKKDEKCHSGAALVRGVMRLDVDIQPYANKGEAGVVP